MRLIDADALFKALGFAEPCSECDHVIGRFCADQIWADVCDAIIDAPTIDAEPVRHGQWLHPEEGDEDYNTVSCSCSVCGWKFNLYEDDIDGAPYCAVCGAKMDTVSPLYQRDEAEP